MRLLLEQNNVDPNFRDASRQTCLCLAANKGHVAIVRLLLARDDAEVNREDRQGRTPL
jgi:ankyrin repeat protein